MTTTPENPEPETVEAELAGPEASAVTEDLSAEDEAQAALLRDIVAAIDGGREARVRTLVEPLHAWPGVRLAQVNKTG